MPIADDSGLHLGSVLDGRYRIDAVLGSGGMGRVYRGEHTGIGKAVAIKVLHADLGRNSEAAQRFQREALASGRLDHANIVGVSDFGIIEDGPCYLVMEALEGESLGDRLVREKRLPWPEAFAILRGVLAGLHHAHERGVVHRDIKPDNIFLALKDGAPVIKILDFGIAKLAAGTADDPASTRAGLTVGTPAYLSPEQAVGGDITPACDLYSTTIVLYEMITGRCPFEDKDALAMLGAHVGRVPPALVQVAPELDLPPGLEELVQKGLAKLVGERIGSAIDYLALMEQISPSPIIVRSPTLASQPVIALPAALGGMLGTPASGTPVLGTAATSNLTPVAVGSARTAAGPVAVALTPLPPVVGAPVAAKGKPVGDDDKTERLIVDGDGEADLPPALKVPTVATAMLPVSPVSAVALARPTVADGREIPKQWIVIGAFVIIGMLIVALVILAVHVSSSEAKAPAAPAVVPPAPEVVPPAKSSPPVPAKKVTPPVDAPTADTPDEPPPPPPPPKKHGGRPRPAGH